MTRKIRIGVISTSWWADMMYLPSLKSHPDTEIAAICGRSPEPAKAMAEKYGINTIYNDHRDLIAHEGLDAVVIAVPDDMHRDITMLALDAGLHVLCEKPLANSLADARAMTEKATASGRKHMVLFTWRFLPHMRYLKHLLDEGYIGGLQHVELVFAGGYARDPKYAWRFDGNRANGVLGDLGSHMIDFFRYFGGEIAEVSANLKQMIDRSSFEGPVKSAPSNDWAHLSLSGVSGIRGEINASAAVPVGDRGMMMGVTLAGDDGMIETRHIFGGREKGIVLRGISGGMQEFETLVVPDSFLDGIAVDDLTGAFIRHQAGPRLFIDAIRDDLQIPMSFADGLKVQEVLEAALASHREGRVVTIA